jgi:hypothetical protein
MIQYYIIAALPPAAGIAICALYEFGQREPRSSNLRQQEIAARVIARRQKISGNRPGKTKTRKGQ